MEADINAEIQRMLSEGIIEQWKDPKGFNSPVFAARKKNGAFRVVANFKRTLNTVLKDQNPYPIPLMDHRFHKIGEGNKYFASLDLKSGYWQIEIKKCDRHKTAFSWGDRCFQYTRLAFGLTSAGHIFSRCVTEVLDIVNARENISAYIDNLVHARTFDEYIIAMRQLFTAFRAYGLKLNLEKCIFIASVAKFWGRIVDSNEFRADPKCVKAIREMKPPTTRKELRSLIGRLIWIRQFLETKLYGSIRTDTFSQLLAPIHALNRDNIKFIGTDDAHRAFEKIKRLLSSPPVISFPDFSSLFTLTTDASDTACGAILMQEAHDGKKKIVAAASHTFNATGQLQREGHSP